MAGLDTRVRWDDDPHVRDDSGQPAIRPGLGEDVESLADELLVGRIAAGDERSLMAVYDRHADVLFGIAVRFLGDREAAAEIVQEVFMALWQRATRFDPEAGTLLGWLIGITRFRSLDRLRSESRRPRLARPGRVTLDPWGEPSHDEPRAWASGARTAVDMGDPALELDRRWTRAVVQGALSEMTEQDRRVLLLAYDDGLSQSEIATRLGWPLGTVKSRTRRAMALLRERLRGIPGLVEP